MHWCVLMCIISFVSLNEKGNVHATNFQTAAPFSNNLLEASDFGDILDQESNEESQLSLVQNREAKSSEDSPPSLCERCPLCQGCQNPSSKAQKKLDVDKVKRELGQAGDLFLKKYFAMEDEEGKGKNDGEEKQKCTEAEGDQDLAKDEEFQLQQENAANLTNVTRTFLYDVEHPQPGNDTEKEKECREKEEETAKDKKEKEQEVPHPKMAKNPRKSVTDGLLDDILELHFFKHSPEVKRRRKKSLFLNLHAKESKHKKPLRAPKKFNYIALLANDKNIVQVPALKFTLVPEDSRERRESDTFEPFFVSRHRKHSHHFKAKPKHDDCCKNSPHLPILFVNADPGLRSDRKRDSNISDNCVRDADLLIQDVTNFLKFNLVDKSKTMPVDAGILVSGNSPDSDKSVFKKEAKGEPVSDSAQDEAEIQQEASMEGDEPGARTNPLRAMEVAPRREDGLGEMDE